MAITATTRQARCLAGPQSPARFRLPGQLGCHSPMRVGDALVTVPVPSDAQQSSDQMSRVCECAVVRTNEEALHAISSAQVSR